MNQFIEWFNYSFIKTVTHRHLLVNTFIYLFMCVCMYVCMYSMYMYVVSASLFNFKANSNYFPNRFPKHFFCSVLLQYSREFKLRRVFWLHTSLSCQIPAQHHRDLFWNSSTDSCETPEVFFSGETAEKQQRLSVQCLMCDFSSVGSTLHLEFVFYHEHQRPLANK